MKKDNNFNVGNSLQKIAENFKIFRILLGLAALGMISLLLYFIPSFFHIFLSNSVNIGNFLSRTIVMATPLLLGTLGEIYVERSGVTNLGVEGMLAMGAILGVIGAFWTKTPWGGVLLAIVGCSLLSLLFGVVVIEFEGMQIPAGLGLFMFGLGLSGIIGQNYVGKSLPYHFTDIPLPMLSEIPFIGPFLFSHGPLVYLTLALVPTMWFILFKTKLGLQIRAVGENPSAADVAGINIFKIRYLCIVIGGALTGMAGSYLSLSWISGWTVGMTGGRGWLIIALTILSLWGPLRALLWAWIFGGIYILQFELQGLGISVRILGMLPFLLPLILLTFILIVSEKSGAPSALLESYRRE